MMGSPRIHGARRRRGALGFTLVELMTVVTIVGILATIGIILVRRHMRSGKSLEAMAVISSIRSAQEARRAETGSYLNVSPTSKWFPSEPSSVRHSFVVPDGGHPDAGRWRELGVSKTDGTQFGFRVYAGLPGPMPSLVLDTAKAVTFDDAKDAWYVIEAGGDLNDDSTALSLYVASSLNGEVYIENEGE